MSAANVDREKYGPGWGEVIIGALLALLLGVLLASLYLILKPVATVSRLPDPKVPAGTVTYMAGSNDTRRGQVWTVKHKALMAGHSSSLSEDELNVAFNSAKPEPAAKSKTLEAKKKEKPAEPWYVFGAINFRIDKNVFQVAVPVKIPLIDTSIILQSSGSFAKNSDGTFVFKPDNMYIGSLGLHSIKGLPDEIVRRLMASEAIPEDMRSVWNKASDVRVEGRTLVIEMPPAQ